MSHTTYITPCFVLGVRNVGEANRLFTLFTRDLGAISATAQSVRLEKSKLRFALQRFSFAEVSVVRGRGGWRVTNAYPHRNMFFEEGGERQRIVISITELLRRLLIGESPDASLFDVVNDGYMTLSVLREEALASFELVFVAKILTSLGYGSDSGVLEKFESGPVMSEELRGIAEKERSLLIKEINAALTSTGL